MKSCSFFLVLAITCAGNAVAADHVKDILADKMRYLSERFSTAAVNKSVIDTITKADSAELNFHKMVFTIVPRHPQSQNGTPQDYQLTLTLIHAGGPFVQSLDELSTNGFPSSMTYALSYRNAFFLDEQSVNLSAQDAASSYVVKNLKAFSAESMAENATGDFEWRYQMAPHIQIMNFKDTYYHCTYGASYEASVINFKLKGSAQDLSCDMRNDNNVVTSHVTVAKLPYYGISIIRSRTSTTSATDFTVTNVEID